MSTLPKTVVEAKGLILRFGPVEALRDIHMSVQAGERLALIGGNGSGKSSLLRLLHGLFAPTTGVVSHAPGSTQAMVFQRPFVLRGSVLENAALGLKWHGVPKAERMERAIGALRAVELAHMGARDARTLSGGQQQRLALARAWAIRPDVLFLDEPTANLDPHAKREVEALLHELPLQSAKPVTLILASHNLGQVKRLASRVAYLEQGRILSDTPVQALFDNPQLSEQHPATHAYLKGETG